jgi:threonine dehydrogenase-like Zn-dependent dehydrogenase
MKVQVPWLTDIRTIEYREESLTLGPNQVLIRHVATAPSIGTALHMYQGDHTQVEYTRRTRPWPYPWLQGYAYGVGRVEEIGAQVDRDQTGLKEGALVYTMKMRGERAVVSPNDLIVLPEGLDAGEATLIFQATVALNGIREAGITLGDTVLVTGQGPIGNFCAQFVELAGAWKVAVSDISDSQLAISRACGIDLAYNARAEDVPQRMRDLTGGRGADIVVEASGSPAALMQCASAARRLGKIAVVGWTMNTFSLNLAEDFVPKGLEMVVCHANRNGSHRAYEKLRGGVSLDESAREDKLFIFDLMQSGKIKAAPMLTHRFPLSKLEEAWKFIDNERGAYSQVLLTSEE